MITRDKKDIGYMVASAGVLGALAWFAWMLVGCAAPMPMPGPAPSTNDVPNLSEFEPGTFRGGQPNSNGWVWLSLHGVSNVVKLNLREQGSDDVARRLGMVVHEHPIDTIQQIDPLVGPDEGEVVKAVGEITPGSFVHCEFGRDRTGLIVGCKRLVEGTNAAAAWEEMISHGYHPAEFGLTRFWDTRAQQLFRHQE